MTLSGALQAADSLLENTYNAAMEMNPIDSRRAAAQDLSKTAAFQIGPLTVEPALRKLFAGGQEITIQPRVMRVLMALAEMDGSVLSRDDLIMRCWDGTIVGDNAINRVISQLRRSLEELTGDEIRVETITKVGFRLVNRQMPRDAPPPAEAAPVPSSGIARRKLILGAAGLGALAIAGTGWAVISNGHHRPDREAAALAAKADLLLKSGLPGSVMQAMTLLERAVARDPHYPAVWGQLAGIYRHALQDFGEGEKRSYPGLVRSAAARALALDPRQPDARLALALLTPWPGNWSAAEKALTAVQREYPRHWYANAQLSLLLLDLGRAAQALPFRRNVIAIDPEIPHAWGFFALNLVLAGRIHEADAALETAADKWPRQPFLWFMRRLLLIETERPREAAAFVRDVRFQPEGMPPSVIARLAGEAEATDSKDAGLRQRAADALIASVEAPQQLAAAAPLIARLGADDLALEAASAFLLGGTVAGRSWPAPRPHEHRPTALLFYPSLRALAARPAYRLLIERTGLSAYWTKSGFAPGVAV